MRWILFGTLFFATAWAQDHSVTVESDTEAPLGDANLSMQVSGDDLLTGAAFVSSLPMQNGSSLTLTDGIGSEEKRGRGTFGNNDTADWVVTFSKSSNYTNCAFFPATAMRVRFRITMFPSAPIAVKPSRQSPKTSSQTNRGFTT
jgi:hypothetical protein